MLYCISALYMTSTVTQIGKYALGREVGKGSFGVVNIAHDHEGNVFAVKTISLTLIDQSGLKMQLKREISILRRLDHPNVVKLIDVLRNKHFVYLITEFVDGGDLFDALSKRGRFSETDARSVFEQIVTGVSYCHSMKVISRDMKVENVLLTKSGQVKICDFGFAQICDEGRFMETVCGTPNYLPPEILKHQPYTSAVDVYSIAVILFYLVAGRLPFDDDSNEIMYNKICAGEYDMPTSFSAELQDLIRQAFKSGKERIKIDELQDHEWMHLTDDAAPAKAAVKQSVTKAAALSRKATLSDFNTAATFQVQDLFESTRNYRKK